MLKTMLRKTAFLQCSVSHMDTETAETILKSFWPDPSTTCVAKNAIDLQYDLQIIVPAYNVEKFVAQCLESALNQKTNYSYLVTVINDGSTDQTLEIIRLCQKKYPNRMEIINQKNCGLSGARNVAMKTLKGRYITFLDSDDVLADDAVEMWLNAAQNGSFDIVQGNWYESIELNGGGTQHNIQESTELSGFPWGKIFKAEVLEHFKFPEGYWFEDTPISFIIYGMGYSYRNISNVVYGYRLNPNGISAKSSDSKRSVESYYITALCLQEFSCFGVPYDKRAYDYFLQQCIMNWIRTRKQPENIREAIFILEAELRKQYFGNMKSINNEQIEMALKKKQFKKFEMLAKAR